MKEKRFNIPLTEGRRLSLLFRKNNEGKWVCVMEDKTIHDITSFIESGFYTLDTSKQLEMK